MERRQLSTMPPTFVFSAPRMFVPTFHFVHLALPLKSPPRFTLPYRVILLYSNGINFKMNYNGWRSVLNQVCK